MQEIAAARRSHTGLGLITLDIDDFSKSMISSATWPEISYCERWAICSTRMCGWRTSPRDTVRKSSRFSFQGRIKRRLRRSRNAFCRGVTLSLGVATYSHTMYTQQLLIDAADEALYASKADGKACWRMAEETLLS